MPFQIPKLRSRERKTFDCLSDVIDDLGLLYDAINTASSVDPAWATFLNKIIIRLEKADTALIQDKGGFSW